VRNLRSD